MTPYLEKNMSVKIDSEFGNQVIYWKDTTVSCNTPLSMYTHGVNKLRELWQLINWSWIPRQKTIQINMYKSGWKSIYTKIMMKSNYKNTQNKWQMNYENWFIDLIKKN